MKRSYCLCINLVILILTTACGGQVTSTSSPDPTTLFMPDYPDCQQAELVSETIPAGTSFMAGEKFDKTWIIRNTSPCNWDANFSLVYYQGVGMGESTHLLFTANMPQGAVTPPGAEVTLTLNLRAPFAAGRQIGYWKLRDSAGILFVPANIHQDALSVDIEVVGTVYSFVDNLCHAMWTLDGHSISCPVNNDMDPFKLVYNSFPVFEGNNAENEPSIEVLLPEEEGSIISGVFPPVVIRNGDHLHLGTGCGNDAHQCDLYFEVVAMTGNERITIGEWHEVSDGNMQSVNLDMSYLAGQSLQFVFTLRSENAIRENRGFWFFPILLPY